VGTPIVPARFRRLVAVVALGCAGVVGLLASRYAGTSKPGAFDVMIIRGAAEVTADHGGATWLAVQFGDPPAVIVMAGALAAVCLLMRRPTLAVLAIVGPGVVGVTTTLLKPALGRTLDGDPAFPSGHTAGVTALALTAGLLLVNVAGHRLLTVAVAVVGLLGASSAVALGLIADGFHYPTDTLGGFCLAVAVVLGLALLIDRVRDRRPAHD
jgi:PAP2 superfamily.